MPMSHTLSEKAARAASNAHALSVVIPAKDEEESLPLIVARIIAASAASGLTLRDIVLVDDGSSDNTWASHVEAGRRRRAGAGHPPAPKFWQSHRPDGWHWRLHAAT